MQRRDVLIAAAAAAAASFGAPVARAGLSELPASAAEELHRQIGLAAGDGKRLFLLFHASWCGYCRLFDRFLADPAAAQILDREFRVFHMRALERTTAQKALQLPGSDDIYRNYTQPSDGLPFFLVFNAQGRPIVTSLSPESGENIGFPVEKHELDTLQGMLKRAAPRLTSHDLATLRTACVKALSR